MTFSSQPLALANALDLQGAFAHLSRRGFAGKDLNEALRQLTESAGRMLNMERLSLWGLSTGRESLECIDLYELSADRHSSGLKLLASNCHLYFQALAQGEPIVADDAMTHPLTSEFANDYLLMNRVSALIHSPIHINGELQGVLCIERVGPHSAWSSVQRLFAHAVANLVTLAIVQNQSSLMREELQDANARLHALFAGNHDAILIADANSGQILDANQQAEKLFGRSHTQLVGVLQSDLHPHQEVARYRALFESHVKTGVSEPVQGEIVNLDGEQIPVKIIGASVELGCGRKIIQNIFRRSINH
jgi:PAS domain S-box-containing protein